MNVVGNTKRETVPILAVLRPKTVERFRHRLRAEGDCLVWTGSRNPEGYGLIDVTYESKAVRFPILTHRLAWALAAQRDPPPDKIVCHRCNNPACCKSAHLYLGTAQTNSDDKLRAGRQARTYLGIKGQDHPATKYTVEQQGAVIRDLASNPPLNFTRAAKLIGCGYQTAQRWWLSYERRCGEVGRVQAMQEWGAA